MKKKLLFVLALSAILTLSGCSQSASMGRAESEAEPEASNKVKIDATDIILDTRSIALYKDDTYQIESLITPLSAYDAALSYNSSNTDVATVSETGLVTAVGNGEATIYVSATDNSQVFQSMKVYVTSRVAYAAGIKAVNAVKRYQNSNVKTAKRLRTYETEKRTLVVDNVVQHYSNSYQEITSDTEQGFFYVGGEDVTTRIAGGAASRSSFGYYIMTNKDYDSHIYHHNDYSKNRCELATQFFLGTDVSRIEVVYKILDSMFSMGRDIATDCYEDELSSDLFGFAALIGRGGGVGDEKSGGLPADVCYDFAQNITHKEDDPNLSTPLMEQNLDIPAYIPYDEHDEFRAYWNNGVVKYYKIHFQLSYSYNGKDYVLDIERTYTFERDDEFQVVYPDKAEFTKVDDIFDL